MPTLQAANNQYQLQQKIAVTTSAAANKLWSKVTDNFDASWSTIRQDMLTLVENGRLAAATSAVGYTDQVLNELGQAAPPTGMLIPAAFVATAPDGTDMGVLLDTAVIRTKMAVKTGSTATEAIKVGSTWLTGTLLTVMADTSRQVVAADIAQRPLVTGYIRMLNTPSCARCVLLAGKWFRWNQGFERHPRCDCRHVPSTDEAAMKDKGLVSDPYEYFRSLSVRDQERLFGKRESEAIRDYGADIYRTMNIKMRGLGTVKGNLKYGTPNKRTVDDILSRDPSRKFVIENLQYHGYITGPQVPGGNILGRYNIGFGQFGKGGVARAASDASTKALLTGVRDPLNRYTMTAAERRLFDAHYKYEYATRTGTLARSVGQNSADIYSQAQKATAEHIAQLRKALETELEKAAKGPTSVHVLADKLGYSSGKLDEMRRMLTFSSGTPSAGLSSLVSGNGSGNGRKPPLRSASSDWPEDLPALSGDVMNHILFGDENGGGHLFGVNKSGKTEFPESWTREIIFTSIAKVLRERDNFTHISERRFVRGVVDGVTIQVNYKVTKQGEEITTAFPIGGTGVVRNIGAK